jgi:hypothetical protein
MRHVRELRSLDQMTLFAPRPTTPHWKSLPAEVRAHTLRLLARFLRQHRRVQLVEVRDE